jgi:hypothetical protein
VTDSADTGAAFETLRPGVSTAAAVPVSTTAPTAARARATLFMLRIMRAAA